MNKTDTDPCPQSCSSTGGQKAREKMVDVLVGKIRTGINIKRRLKATKSSLIEKKYIAFYM